MTAPACEQACGRVATTRCTPGFAPDAAWDGCDECAARTTRCQLLPLTTTTERNHHR